jgi:hypothetical protein
LSGDRSVEEFFRHGSTLILEAGRSPIGRLSQRLADERPRDELPHTAMPTEMPFIPSTPQRLQINIALECRRRCGTRRVACRNCAARDDVPLFCPDDCWSFFGSPQMSPCEFSEAFRFLVTGAIAIRFVCRSLLAPLYRSDEIPAAKPQNFPLPVRGTELRSFFT